MSDPVPINETWVATHCRIAKYFLQIVKCTKWECCGEFCTSWLKLFPQRFLPAPVPLQQSGEGPEVPSVNDARHTDLFLGLWKRNIVDLFVPNSRYSALPYDSYCLSVMTKVTKRVCKKCDIYYPSIGALKQHQKVCSSGIDTVDEESSDEEFEQITEAEMEEEALIMNIFDILQNSAFVEVENGKNVGAF